jgi:CheY-like chemotaxis protein
VDVSISCTCEKGENKGTKVEFNFVTQKTKQAILSEKQTADSSKNIFNNMKILLVEDKKVTQKVIGLMLKDMGHSIEIANHGQEAIDMYPLHHFDLILMDIQMPVMDGITATKILRNRYHNLPPIVGLSANAFEGDRKKYMEMGLDEYLTKPVKQEDFSRVLRSGKLFRKTESL